MADFSWKKYFEMSVRVPREEQRKLRESQAEFEKIQQEYHQAKEELERGSQRSKADILKHASAVGVGVATGLVVGLTVGDMFIAPIVGGVEGHLASVMARNQKIGRQREVLMEKEAALRTAMSNITPEPLNNAFPRVSSNLSSALRESSFGTQPPLEFNMKQLKQQRRIERLEEQLKIQKKRSQSREKTLLRGLVAAAKESPSSAAAALRAITPAEKICDNLPLSDVTWEDFEVVGERCGRRPPPNDNTFYGTSAAVYRLRYHGSPEPSDELEQHYYAAKVMFNFYGTSYIKQKENFERDYRIPGSIPPHPNVARVYCHFRAPLPDLPDFPELVSTHVSDDGIGHSTTTVIIMDFYKESLMELLNEERVSGRPFVTDWRIPAYRLLQVIRGLVHLFEHQIVHRDVKPDNILVGEGERLVIADFGTSLDTRKLKKDFKIEYNDGTLRGGITKALPPEILYCEIGDTLDYSKSDVYSAGILAYSLCGMDTPDVLEGLALPTLELMPETFNCLIHNMLSYSAADRPSLFEAEKALQGVLYLDAVHSKILPTEEWLYKMRLEELEHTLHLASAGYSNMDFSYQRDRARFFAEANLEKALDITDHYRRWAVPLM